MKLLWSSVTEFFSMYYQRLNPAFNRVRDSSYVRTSSSVLPSDVRAMQSLSIADQRQTHDSLLTVNALYRTTFVSERGENDIIHAYHHRHRPYSNLYSSTKPAKVLSFAKQISHTKEALKLMSFFKLTQKRYVEFLFLLFSKGKNALYVDVMTPYFLLMRSHIASFVEWQILLSYFVLFTYSYSVRM